MKLDNASLNIGGALVVRKAEVQAGAKKISDTYNEFAKLVFLFDVSGSMDGRVAYDLHGNSYVTQFLWNDFPMIRAKVASAVASANMAESAGTPWQYALDWDERETMKVADEARGARGEVALTADDEELKARIVRTGTTDHFGVLPDVFNEDRVQPPTKMELVKRLAKSEIGARFAKYPKSRVAVVAFGSEPVTVFDDGGPDQVDAELDKLEIGFSVMRRDPKTGEERRESANSSGTEIMKALKKGMDICREKPSPVGIHHIIIVSDGGDSSTRDIGAWIVPLRASGVVLDYIHIGEAACANEDLRDACRKLGGEMVVVNTEGDLKEKFMNAVHRAMLPPASV